MGRDSRSATKDRRNRLATSPTTPTASASAAAALAEVVPPAATNGTMTAAAITATLDSGPKLSQREVPRMAYSGMATSAAHRPVTGDSPAMMA